MTNQHPITPPPVNLLHQWMDEALNKKKSVEHYVARKAAQWGADQELEACCEWFQEFYKTESWVMHDLKHFRTARRPKPPNLKQQSIALLDLIQGNEKGWQLEDLDVVRRALEALPND